MKRCNLIIAIAFAVIVCGCGSDKNPAGGPHGDVNMGAPMFSEFVAPSESITDKQHYVEKYVPLFGETDGSSTYIISEGAYNNLQWRFVESSASNSSFKTADYEYHIEMYDLVSEESTQKKISIADLESSGDFCFITDMKVYDEYRYAFIVANFVLTPEGSYTLDTEKMVFTDFDAFCETVDLTEVLKEIGTINTESTESPEIYNFRWSVDRERNIYIVDSDESGSSFHVIDKSCNEVINYTREDDERIGTPFIAESGMVLPIYDTSERSYSFFYVDVISGNLELLAKISPDYYIEEIFGMCVNTIYYKSSREGRMQIESWDISNGSRNLIFDYAENGINPSDTFLYITEDNALFLKLYRWNEEYVNEWIAKLIPEKVPYNTVNIVSFVASNSADPDIIAQSVAKASLKDPNKQYSYSNLKNNDEKNIQFNEIISGNIPDIMYVSYDEMLDFYNKGILSDISNYISPEIATSLLPGVKKLGVIDGNWVGLAPRVYSQTLIISGDISLDADWDLKDIVDLMERDEVVHALNSNTEQSFYLEPKFSLMALIKYSLNDSSLIDWENKECNFTDSSFVRLLELTERDLSKQKWETKGYLNNGKNIVWCNYFSLLDIIKNYNIFKEENGKAIGFPSTDSKGILLTDGYLVVKKDADAESVKYFLSTLASKEIQTANYGFSMSILKEIYKDYTFRDENGVLWYLFPETGIKITEDSSEENAVSFALKYLEECEAFNYTDESVWNIISEELDEMYANGRSAQRTAEIINSRVQIYLDETK